MRTSCRNVARFGLHHLLVALCTLFAHEATAAGDDQLAVGVSQAVTLKANRISHWDTPEARWVLLEGKATVFQGDTGTAVTDSALARVKMLPTGTSGANPAEQNAVIDIFSMGNSGAVNPLKSPALLSLRTNQRLSLRALTTDGVQALQACPPNFSHLEKSAQVEPRSQTTPHESREERESNQSPRAMVEPKIPDSISAVASPEFIAAAGDKTELERQIGGIVSPRSRATSLKDSEVRQAQAPGFDPNSMTGTNGPVFQEDPSPNNPYDAGGFPISSTDLEPLSPDDLNDEIPDSDLPGTINPESQRTWSTSPRYGGRQASVDVRKLPDGRTAAIYRGGVIIVSDVPGRGRVDLSADHAVVWTRSKEAGATAPIPEAGGEAVEQDANQELEVYLEGDVIIRNDRMQYAGSADQTMFKANSAYYDFRTERLVALDAEINIFAPGLMSPIRTKSPLINQYREPMIGPNGNMVLGTPRITAEESSTTGSRFPEPGYRFRSRSVDITQVEEPLRDPFTGGQMSSPRGPDAPRERNWLVDSRQNFYFMGPIPVFYWPRVRATDDFDPPIRNLSFRYGNYFGYQIMTKPSNIDTWNIDIDYLSLRGPALGSEIGWFGRDLFGDIADPYGKRGRVDTVDQPYFGYFDVWGINDHHYDVLGPGPAIVTNGPPGAGKAGYQRTDVPSFTTNRGRFLFRHMQSLLGDDAEPDDDLRIQLEAGGYTDRNFLEQYYKRLFDSGLDQNTLGYMNYQHRNQAMTLTGQVNYMNWITDTQWLPKFEYYRIGDTLLDNIVSYSSNYGVDYANVHTASEVNNPNLFAFIPYDPISNTSGPWSSGRAWTTQQAEIPINLDFMRIIPYGQGQFMGWSNQLNNQPAGRAWGAFGVRANMMAWRLFPDFESELFNVHGLAHKINLDVDYRSAYSNMGLNSIGIQDNLDDDTYEYVRRYFAMTNYAGGILPPQYDPRFLLLRRSLDPIAFSPDVQGTIQTLKLGLHQRLQTKRGPEGRRRIVDYMILDLQSTFYPNSKRDNFGQPFGQTTYNYEWFLGDRTSLVSTGWFEFWNINGNPILATDPRHTNDPFGLSVVTAGVSINRPPRGNIYLGYTIVNTGPIATSALNSAFNYWLSPKWYGSFAMSYDFGNGILLGTTFSLTKITADYLTSVGLSVDPQRQNYTFGLEIAPRFSPTAKLGSAVGTRFDSRFAPTQ